MLAQSHAHHASVCSTIICHHHKTTAAALDTHMAQKQLHHCNSTTRAAWLSQRSLIPYRRMTVHHPVCTTSTAAAAAAAATQQTALVSSEVQPAAAAAVVQPPRVLDASTGPAILQQLDTLLFDQARIRRTHLAVYSLWQAPY